jgi:mycoredoxin
MPLLLYSASWCRDCREAKRFLKKHQIPFTEIDIETAPGAADELIAHVGKRAIPHFVLDGKWIQPYRPGEGFLHEEMAELLGLGGSKSPWLIGSQPSRPRFGED